MKLTATEKEILNHRLTAPESIWEAIEKYGINEVDDFCKMLTLGGYEECKADNAELTADILQDAVDGSTYLGHANHMSKQWERATYRAGCSLAEKVSAFIGRQVEFAGY